MQFELWHLIVFGVAGGVVGVFAVLLAASSSPRTSHWNEGTAAASADHIVAVSTAEGFRRAAEGVESAIDGESEAVAVHLGLAALRLRKMGVEVLQKSVHSGGGA